WLAFFERAAQGKDHLTPDDLRLALMPPSPPKTAKKGPPSGMPSPKLLIEALFRNELGSPFEGPRAATLAPDSTLARLDGEGTVTLSRLLGDKPVVLIFGSFS